MAEAAVNLESSNQAAAGSGSIEDIALIEEQVDSGLTELLENYQPANKLADMPTDSLDQRFTILPSEALPQYDSSCAKAYAARDSVQSDRPMMALVCDASIPLRQFAIDQMVGLVHPSLCTLRGAGNVKLSTTKELRHVLFLDRPSAPAISEQYQRVREMHERHIIDQILVPIIDALAAMSEKSVCHGRINASNVYFGDRAVLGECTSEPQGLSQQMFYEPLERLLADPHAKGAATEKSDAYALGILTYDILFGIDRYEHMNRDELAKALVDKGAYHCYIAHKEIGESLTDFFRGTLVDNKQERWGLEQLRSWAAGKRFNLIMPSIPKEATRPYEFNESEYFSCRSLAHGIFSNWSSAAKQLRDGKLERWLEMSAHQSDRADDVNRTIRAYGGEHGGTDRVNSEMLARLITVLDPIGPIRYRSAALNPDGLGLAIARYYQDRDHTKLNMMMRVIEMDLANYWSDMSDTEKTPLTMNILWILQRLRGYLTWKQFGFGMERIVYDLNPSLSCQSEMLKAYAVTDINQTLNVLDNIAKTNGANTSLADRQLAAFLASKVEMAKEVKFNQLNKVPNLRDHPELLVMRILNIAQDKSGKPKLVGLATWCAMRVDKLLENIHSRKLRRNIREKLRLAAKSGAISRVLAVVVENDMTKEDHLGFTKANTLYLRNNVKIDALKSGSTLEKMAQDFGGRIAVFIGYTILCITFYSVLDRYYL